MFKIGDYITGIDRSYLRSLYRVVDIYSDKIRLEFCILAGLDHRRGLREYEHSLHHRADTEEFYRQATEEEIRQYELSIQLGCIKHSGLTSNQSYMVKELGITVPGIVAPLELLKPGSQNEH